MKRFTFVLGFVLMCVAGSVVRAEAQASMGVIVDVDLVAGALLLETREGAQRVSVAPTAAIRGDDGRPLTLGDLRPGDAVSYQLGSEAATRLHVAPQFWALPREP